MRLRPIVPAAGFLLMCANVLGGQGPDPTKIGLIGPCGPQGGAKTLNSLRMTGKREVRQNFIIDHQWQSGDAVEIRSDGGVLRYCEVRNGLNDAIEVYASDVTIDSCRIHHFLASTFKKQKDAHGITGRPNRLVIRNCEISYVTGDAVQFDPDRKEWDDVTIENCEMWTGPLPADAAGFKKGERPGENAFDSKTTQKGKRPKVTMRNCIFYGWGHGQISAGAAINVKENVDCLVENCVFFDNDICARLRGKKKPGFGAHVTMRNCFFYDSDVAVRYEDRIENLQILDCGWGRGLKAQLMSVGGAGAGFVTQGGRSVGPMPRLPDGRPAFGLALQQFLTGGRSLAAVDELQKKMEETPPEEEQPQVVEVTFREVEKALEENRFADAVDIIGQRRKEAGSLAGPVLDVLAERAERGKALVQAVAGSGEQLKGYRMTVTVAGMRTLGKIKSASADALTVDAVGMECKIRFQDIRPSTLHRLAGHAMQGTPQEHLLLARFLVDIGRIEEAVEALEELRKDPEVGEDARRILSDL